MSEALNYFSVSVKKIENTKNDYEMISSLNPCFATLPKEKLNQIEDIALKAIEQIKTVLKSDSGKIIKPL